MRETGDITTLSAGGPTRIMARILLIDDNDSIRTVLQETLAHFGHTVIEARNGKEGLELFQHANVDLVITDIVMPERDGLDVVRALREKDPPVNIIAISGAGGRAEDYLELAHVMGAVKVLLKPFSTDVLMAAVNELLPAGGAPPPVSE
jgi:CheY-like chemotaxis protein